MPKWVKSIKSGAWMFLHTFLYSIGFFEALEKVDKEMEDELKSE
jgi:hypothetical protein